MSADVRAASDPSSPSEGPAIRNTQWIRALTRGAWLAPVAVALAAATVVIVPTTAHLGTTHAGASIAGFVADAAAGWVLIAAGAFSLWQRAISAIGSRTLLAGVAWYAADWVGWVAGPPLVRSIAELVSALYLAIVIDVAVSARRPAPGWSWRAIGAAYATAAVLFLATTLLRDPRFDAGCWQHCGDAGFALLPNTTAAGALATATAAAVVVAGAFLAMNALDEIRLRRRSATAAIAVAGGVVGTVSALHALAVAWWPPENPYEPGFAWLFQAAAWSAVALGGAIIISVARVRRARRALAGLGSTLAEDPDPRTLQGTLASATGDRSLRVAYPRDGSRRPVDVDGRPLETPLGGPGRATLALTRGGRAIAILEHDPAMIDAGSLRDELGAAGLLAIENERLRAELQAHARDLRASRREIVATMDHARQRLERDLHDGAQQRLIALGYDLALAGAAVRDSAPATADTLRAVRDEVRRALEELRELAHGIFPAVLDESGLTPALHTLAERAPIPVELEALPGGRLPATVESAAYVTVDQVVAGAARQGATFVRVAVEPDGDGLTLVVDHDGDATPAAEITSTTDRVGAVGGRLSIEAVGAVTRVRAWIPPVADGRA